MPDTAILPFFNSRKNRKMAGSDTELVGENGRIAVSGTASLRTQDSFRR